MPNSLRLIGLSAALFGLACAGLEDTTSSDPYTPSNTGGSSGNSSGEAVSAFNIKTGDCFQDVNGTSITDLTVVPCNQPHDNEVFYVFDVSLPAFNESQIETESESRCVGQFQSYVGTDYNSSKYYVSWITPTSGSWNNGDREVICILFEQDAQMVGSARGTRE